MFLLESVLVSQLMVRKHIGGAPEFEQMNLTLLHLRDAFPRWGFFYLSNEKKGPWLFRGFVGDDILPSSVGL